MINPTASDVGRRVVYTMPHGEVKSGIVSSWNDEWVFVRYTTGDTAAATHRKDLNWR